MYFYLADCDSLEELCGMAVGAASMCWTDVRNAGVFDSDKASSITDELVARIRERQIGYENYSMVPGARDFRRETRDEDSTS